MTKEEWIKIYTAKDGTWDKDYLIDKAYEIITSPIRTNYDRIKSMSVEEMAEWLEKWRFGFSPITEDEKQDFNESVEKLKQWLLQEVNENDR